MAEQFHNAEQALKNNELREKFQSELQVNKLEESLFSEFIRNAPEGEKQKVFEKVLGESIKEQMAAITDVKCTGKFTDVRSR